MAHRSASSRAWTTSSNSSRSAASCLDADRDAAHLSGMRIARLSTLLLAGACTTAPRVVTTPAPSRPTTAIGNPVQHFVDSLIDVPDFRSAHWGILIVDPT